MPLLEKLDARIKELKARNAEMRLELEQLKAENDELRREAEEAKALKDKAQLDVEYMEVSHKLADNPDSLIKTRRRISQLIRNIDRCLEMLKD